MAATRISQLPSSANTQVICLTGLSVPSTMWYSQRVLSRPVPSRRSSIVVFFASGSAGGERAQSDQVSHPTEARWGVPAKCSMPALIHLSLCPSFVMWSRRPAWSYVVDHGVASDGEKVMRALLKCVKVPEPRSRVGALKLSMQPVPDRQCLGGRRRRDKCSQFHIERLAPDGSPRSCSQAECVRAASHCSRVEIVSGWQGAERRRRSSVKDSPGGRRSMD